MWKIEVWLASVIAVSCAVTAWNLIKDFILVGKGKGNEKK